MEMDMRMFDCEVRLDDLEDYMFAEPSEYLSFYQEGHDGGGQSWHASGGFPAEKSVYSMGSPSLSRSSSRLSILSDSSMSFDNRCSKPRGVIYNGHATAGVHSSLSQLTRSCSSSLQSFESDEFDDAHALDKSQMVVGSDPSVTSEEHLNADLSSLMESMLGVDGDLVGEGQYGDWTAASYPHLKGIATEPNSILDVVDANEFVPGNMVGYNVQYVDQHVSALVNSGEVLRSQALGSDDALYQHLSVINSFENCHTVQSSGFQPRAVLQLGIRSEEDFNGIRLVHLLLAGAEAVACMNLDLATVILFRLKELVSRRSSTMQRVAAYFCEGLQYKMEGVKGPERAFEPHSDSLSAFQVLHEVSPYIKFAHFTANQSILEAFEGERRVHIIDYDILEGIQWPSLMQALACRKGGPPHMRITALCRPHLKRALAMTQETGKRLTEFAASFNIPFSFHQVRIDNEDEFRPSLLKQVKGECLAVNCMLHLPHMPHRSKSTVTTLLRAIHKLCPKVMTLVEEELSCSAPTFVSHFFEALHHYSAIFDSLEASLSSESKGRMLVERIFLAPRITSLMTSSNSEQEHGGGDGNSRWHSLALAEGFSALPLSVYNVCQAKLLLGLFSDGYKVEEDHNRLLLGWRSKILLAASAWQCR